MPYSVGSILSKIPYTKRPGIGYTYQKRLQILEWSKTSSLADKQDFVYERIKKLTDFAYQNIEFYASFYKLYSFDPIRHLNSFDDLKHIPIICKSDLQKFNIEQRSFPVANRYKVNTAGSSGVPLEIYIQSDSMGHEWAHMHTIWSKLGFSYQDLKLTLVGRVVGTKFLQYDAARHSFNLNIYTDYSTKKKELFNLLKSKAIKFIHGYPSAVYQLCVFLNRSENRELLTLFRNRIQGVFLGSEYPIKSWRELICNTFEAPSMSWYGHTERTILAYEKERDYSYCPFLTYGFAEAVEINGKVELIGTSYYNYASPLIRYNTQDVIESVESFGGIIESFNVSNGRLGEFIVDAKGSKISLTGLIYGRHHDLFNYCSHIQIFQEERGKATILYVLIKKVEIEFHKLFDDRNVEIKFFFHEIEKPILTKSGKLKLLIKDNSWQMDKVNLS